MRTKASDAQETVERDAREQRRGRGRGAGHRGADCRDDGRHRWAAIQVRGVRGGERRESGSRVLYPPPPFPFLYSHSSDQKGGAVAHPIQRSLSQPPFYTPWGVCLLLLSGWSGSSTVRAGSCVQGSREWTSAAPRRPRRCLLTALR